MQGWLSEFGSSLPVSQDEHDVDADSDLYILGSWSGWTKMELMERKGPGCLTCAPG